MERNLKKALWNGTTPRVFLLETLGCTPKEQDSFHFSSSFSLLSLSSFSLFFLSLISYGPRGLNTLLPLVWSTKEALGGIKTPPCHLNRHIFFFKIFKGPVDRYLYLRSTEWPIFQFLEKSSRHANLFPSFALYGFYPLFILFIKTSKFQLQ